MKSKFFSERIVLIILFLLAIVLRLYSLDSSPPGFNADEAALGYNAYSLLKTGKDEWGQSFPIVFKSFSDYKPGVYVYLAMPFVAVLGLSELAVRLPSIIFGSLSVVFIYLLAKELFKSKWVAVSAGVLLAISPWHLHYSRGAWETNVATFFMMLGVWAFVKAFESSKYWIVAVLGFLISMYAYQSTRVVVPALGMVLLVIYYKDFLAKKFQRVKDKYFVGATAIGVVLTVPLLLIVLSSAGQARFEGISIFTDTGVLAKLNQVRGEDPNPNGLGAHIYHNKLVAYSLSFLEHYFDHFTSNFLFTSGDPLGRNKVPEMGEAYLFEALTLILGVYFLLRNKFKYWLLPVVWLLVAPIAASLTYQTPHALRAQNMVIPLELISGLGLGLFLEQIYGLRRMFYVPIYLVMFLICGYFILRFFHEYFVHLPKQYALEWEYGFSKLVPYVFENKDKYQKVIITDRYDQPYILFLFYSKYDPAKYQQSAKPTGVDKFGFSTVRSFDNLEFRPVGQDEVGKDPEVMYVGTQLEVGDGHKPLKEIDFPNGTPAFKIVGSK